MTTWSDEDRKMEPTQSEIDAAISTASGLETAAFHAGWRAALARPQSASAGRGGFGRPFARTQMKRGGVTFVASTIIRHGDQGRPFSETIAWEWDEATDRPAHIAGTIVAGAESIDGHCAMLRRIHETGSAADPEESDDA